MAKNIIASIQYNNPEFIPLQVESLNKYCQDSFDFFIVDNSEDKHVENEINRQCNIYNISLYKCLKCHHKNHSRDHGISINEFKNYFAIHYKKQNLIILDSDTFLPKTTNFGKYFEKHKMFGDIQIRPVNAKEGSEIVKYLWPGYCGFRYDCDFDQINFDSNFIGNIHVDAGGFLHYYIKDKLDQIYFTRCQADGDFHLVCGSNWSSPGTKRPYPENISNYKNRKKAFLGKFNLKYFSEYAVDQFLNNFAGRVN